MRAQSIMLTAALLAATLLASPAGATQRCSNVLGDGRVIVEGPLFNTLGQVCSVAVIRGGAGLTVIQRERFAGNTLILSPPFAVAPQRVVIVEQPFAGASAVLLPSPGFPARIVVPFATSPGLVAVPTMRTTTGSIGPLTTFSNSQPLAGSVVITRPSAVILTPSTGMVVRRR